MPSFAARPSAPGLQRLDVVGGLAWLLVVTALAWRITIGIDLADESYYAIFLDDWLKGGIRSSVLLSPHQSAALLLYPMARAYVAIHGSESGLILSLRTPYLLGSALASAGVFAFLRLVSWRGTAWFAALPTLAFIPFGLPALLQHHRHAGIAGGSAAFVAPFSGIASPRTGVGRPFPPPPSQSRPSPIRRSLHCSRLRDPARVRRAAGPPFSPRRLRVAGGRRAGDRVDRTRRHLGLGRLSESALYLKTCMDGELPRKLSLPPSLLEGHPAFAAACLAAVALGLLRNRAGPIWTSVAIGLLILPSAALQPALYLASHDIVVLLALSGLGLLGGFAAAATRGERLIAILYVASMAAGAVTTFAAWNSIYNFCIGGFPAAILSVATAGSAEKCSATIARFAVAGRTALAGVLLLASSLSHFYGENPVEAGPRQYIKEGIFAGLAVRAGQAVLLGTMRDRLLPLIGSARTIAAFGHFPGLILLTPARTLMPIPFFMPSTVSDACKATTQDFYRKHPPMLIFDYRDAAHPHSIPVGPHFAEMYQPSSVIPMVPWTSSRRAA